MMRRRPQRRATGSGPGGARRRPAREWHPVAWLPAGLLV